LQANLPGLQAKQKQCQNAVHKSKQQPAGLIACGLRAAALFSSAPSLPQKRHQPELMPFVGGDGGYSPAG